MASNLISAESISKSFDVKSLIIKSSLGISENDRIGIVGRNGGGKSTLLKILAGIVKPDSGRVSLSHIVNLGMLHQTDFLDSKIKSIFINK